MANNSMGNNIETKVVIAEQKSWNINSMAETFRIGVKLCMQRLSPREF